MLSSGTRAREENSSALVRASRLGLSNGGKANSLFGYDGHHGAHYLGEDITDFTAHSVRAAAVESTMVKRQHDQKEPPNAVR